MIVDFRLHYLIHHFLFNCNRISKNRLTDQRTERIRSVAVLEGQVVRRKFLGNVAYDTPLEDIYGGNVQRLKGLKQRVDPQNVTGLAGGFKI